MKQHPYLLYIIICAVPVALYACGATTAANDAGGEKAELPALEEMVTAVTTEKVILKDFEYLINANGKIRAKREQLISCQTGGRLLISRAQTGKLFAAGSLIAQLDTTIIRYRLEREQLSKFNSEREYESQLLGYENLLKGKSAEQAKEIRQKLRISTGLAGAEQGIKEALHELSRSAVRAPFSGMLADVSVQENEQLRPGQEMFRIYDPSVLLLEIKVMEADIFLLKAGMPATVAPVSMPELNCRASILEINPYVDENGLVLVKLGIQNGANKLFPGMNCSAVIKAPFRKTLVVPKEAVIMRKGAPLVFTLEDGRAQWNYVSTGRDNGKEVEIKEGLKAGQLVIKSNNLQLEDGAPVKENIH